MSLVGQTVRIIVIEPFQWSDGNLFGKVLTDVDGKKITVKLSRQIKSGDLVGDTVELKLRNENQRFVILENYGTLIVNGTLVTIDKEKTFEFTGNVTLD